MDLVEELQQQGRWHPTGAKETGKIAFLQHRDAIQKAIEAGYRHRDIWTQLKGKDQMPIGFRQFERYMATLLRSDHSQRATETIAAVETAEPNDIVLSLNIRVPMSANGTPRVVVREANVTDSNSEGSRESRSETRKNGAVQVPFDAQPSEATATTLEPDSSAAVTTEPAEVSTPSIPKSPDRIGPSSEWDSVPKPDELY